MHDHNKLWLSNQSLKIKSRTQMRSLWTGGVDADEDIEEDTIKADACTLLRETLQGFRSCEWSIHLL